PDSHILPGTSGISRCCAANRAGRRGGGGVGHAVFAPQNRLGRLFYSNFRKSLEIFRAMHYNKKVDLDGKTLPLLHDTEAAGRIYCLSGAAFLSGGADL